MTSSQNFAVSIANVYYLLHRLWKEFGTTLFLKFGRYGPQTSTRKSSSSSDWSDSKTCTAICQEPIRNLPASSRRRIPIQCAGIIRLISLAISKHLKRLRYTPVTAMRFWEGTLQHQGQVFCLHFILPPKTTNSITGNIIPGGRAGSAAHDPFSLGRRVDILRNGNHMAISSYVAEEDNAFHGIEVPFRHFNLALLDNVSAEYSFMTEMFSTLTFHQITRKAAEIFEPVFNLGYGLTKKLIEQTSDSLGVLLCVRLNQHAAFELQRRKVPVADSYINGVNMQLWPKFQVIMDAHCESLKRVAANTGRSAASALSLAGGDDLNQSSAPHFLTQRFGQLAHGILVLSSDSGDDEPVSNSLARLTAEFDSLLTKLSRSGGDAKRRERFLYNNYSLILTIISVCFALLILAVWMLIKDYRIPRASWRLNKNR